MHVREYITDEKPRLRNIRNSHFRRSVEYTAISIKFVLPKAQTVNYERSTEDELMLIFTSKLGIISLKQHLAILLARKVISRVLEPK